MFSGMRRRFSVVLAGLFMLQPLAVLRAQQPQNNHRGLVSQYYISPDKEPAMSHDDLVRLLQQKVKYLFVFYQENRSFDSLFGTFPRANGLFSQPAAQTPGFTQNLVDINGNVISISPFRIGPYDTCPDSKVNGTLSPNTCYAADTDDVDHSHPRIVAKMDIQSGVPLMDQFAQVEELKYYTPPANPSLKAKQMGELTMAYEDCDTVPLLWGYADEFVLFDNIFQAMTGPSTPGNLAIIGAQAGQTQWALHPLEAYIGNGGSGSGVPVLDDDDPLWGSPSDPYLAQDNMPVNPTDYPGYTTEINLTFATLPLTMAGGNLQNVVKTDRDPSDDLADVQDDVAFISKLRQAPMPFGWYEEGFDKEVTDNDGPEDANGTHASYITHHNGPQYFGYIANNPQMSQNLHGLGDFFTAVETKTLPKQGGVFFVKGGYTNLFSLTPGDPDSKVQGAFLGDDDHPAYSDAQISDAMVAEAINAIAASPYWKDCAIIITFDDSEGDYDHVQPPLRTYGPDGSLITNGPRVPLILISPYARTHHISHEQGSQSSVVKFIDTVFNLPPLALLPDELNGRQLAQTEFDQENVGPEDAITPDISDLVDAFSPSRLSGKREALPPFYVTVPNAMVTTLPANWGFGGCSYLGITTTDRALGITNTIPADFNPRPKTNPN
jgi:phospholipase C